MSASDPCAGELEEFAAALKQLRPAASRIDRDRLMFELGRDSVRARRNGRWIWPIAAAASLLIAAGLGVQFGRYDAASRVAGAPAVLPSTAAQLSDRPGGWEPPPPSDIRFSHQLARFDLDRLARPGVLGVRGIQPTVIERSPISVGEANDGPVAPRVPPTLRAGDRDAWRRWFDEDSSRKSIQDTSTQKESA